MAINEGFNLSPLWSSIVSVSVSLSNSTVNCLLSSTIPDKEHHIITQDSETTNEISTSIFNVGETLLYSNAGRTSYVKVEEVFINDDGVL